MRADPVCAAVLDRLPRLGLPEWWLTAGAVFQNVWNQVEGRPPGFGIKDYDVFYFDDADLSWEAEDRVIRSAAALFSDLEATIEVRNEARVHLWYEDKFGVAAEPFTSARDAIDAFASTTCCVGVTTTPSGVEVYAPHGLEDVFALHMRPNPRLAPQVVYEAKVSQYQRRWPTLTATPWPGQPGSATGCSKTSRFGRCVPEPE
ncbi:MAG TPA: nucleotidyltransferase family protein [Marmoricola sp.]|nr:nucleotidyltransferase family protein [Marmoricola sp.]